MGSKTFLGNICWSKFNVLSNAFLRFIRNARRIPDFPDSYSTWNFISSYGSIITTFGMVFFFLAIICKNENYLNTFKYGIHFLNVLKYIWNVEKEMLFRNKYFRFLKILVFRFFRKVYRKTNELRLMFRYRIYRLKRNRYVRFLQYRLKRNKYFRFLRILVFRFSRFYRNSKHRLFRNKYFRFLKILVFRFFR